MVNSEEQSSGGAVISEVFAFGGIECRMTLSQSPAGYTARTFCPFCGNGFGGTKLAANRDLALLQTKAEFQDHFGQCPMRNIERPPVGAKLN
jgi:hypothetical protein